MVMVYDGDEENGVVVVYGGDRENGVVVVVVVIEMMVW